MSVDMQAHRKPARFSLRSAYVLALVIAISISVVSYAISLGIGIWALFVNEEGVSASAEKLPGLPLYLLLFTVWVIGPVEPRIYDIYATVVAIFLLAFGASIFVGKRFDRAVLDAFRSPLRESFRNWLFTMPLLTSMLLLVLEALIALQESQGIETGSLEITNPYTTFFWISHSVVFEELGVRIIPIGTFLLAHGLIFNIKRFADLKPSEILKAMVLSYVLPSRFRAMMGLNTIDQVGLRRGVRRGEWAVILLTSSIFSFSHILGGWGIGRLSELFITGVVLGLVFLTYGAGAVILVHWTANSHFGAYYILGLSQESAYLAYFSYLLAGAVGWLGGLGYGLTIAFRRASRAVRDRSAPTPTVRETAKTN